MTRHGAECVREIGDAGSADRDANDTFLTFKAVSPPGIETCVPTGPAGQAVGIPIVAGEYLAIWTQKDATGRVVAGVHDIAPPKRVHADIR